MRYGIGIGMKVKQKHRTQSEYVRHEAIARTRKRRRNRWKDEAKVMCIHTSTWTWTCHCVVKIWRTICDPIQSNRMLCECVPLRLVLNLIWNAEWSHEWLINVWAKRSALMSHDMCLQQAKNSYNESEKKSNEILFYDVTFLNAKNVRRWLSLWACFDFETWQKKLKLKLNMRNLTEIYLNRLLCLSRCCGLFFSLALFLLLFSVYYLASMCVSGKTKHRPRGLSAI